MKKILLLFASGITALALHAASNSSQQPTATEKQDNQPVAEAPFPLHDACDQDGSLEQLRKTIEALSANNTLATRINEQDKNGNTALHVAARRQELPMVQALLDAGASPKILNTADNLPCDFLLTEDEPNHPLNSLLAVNDEERQVLVQQARDKEIDQANEINEMSIKPGKISVVEVSNPDLD